MSKVEDAPAQALQPVDSSEAASAGAALLVLAAEKAFELGPPEDRRIYKLSTNTGAILEIFESVDEACKSNARLTQTKLLRALRGTTSSGFAWCYADEHAKNREGGDEIYDDNDEEDDGPDDEEFVDEGDTKPRRKGLGFGSSIRPNVSSAPAAAAAVAATAAAVAESIAHLPSHLPSFSHLHSKPATSAKRRVVKISMHPDSLGKILNTYPSIRLAADSIGVERSLVSKCCRGINVSAGGFMWRYEDAVAAIAADADAPLPHISRAVHNRVVSSILHDPGLVGMGASGLGRGTFSSRLSHMQESQQSGGFVVLSHRTISPESSSRGAPAPASSSSSSTSSSSSSSSSSSTAAAAPATATASTSTSIDITDGSSHSIVVGASSAGTGPAPAAYSPDYIEVLVQYKEAQMWVGLDELLDKQPQAFVLYMKHLQPVASRSLSALVALQESGASQTQSSVGFAAPAVAAAAPAPASVSDPVPTAVTAPLAAAAAVADPTPVPFPAAGQKRAREPDDVVDGQEG